MTGFDRLYHDLGTVETTNPDTGSRYTLPIVACVRCAALIVDDDEHANRRGHDNMHDRIEAALNLASGYPADA